MIIEDQERKVNRNTGPMVKEVRESEWFGLDMYDIPQVDFPSFSELAAICKERIDAYKKLDRFREKFSAGDRTKDWLTGIRDVLASRNYRFFNNRVDDLISHWIMKLLFNEENKSDLLINEGNIFSARLFNFAEKYAMEKEREKGMNKAEMAETKEEKEKRRFKWIKEYYLSILLQYHDFELVEGKNPDGEKENRVKVPFRFCSRLLEKYDVTLENGYAIVTPDNVLIVIQDIFSEILHAQNSGVKKLYKQIMKSDERLPRLLKLLNEFHKTIEFKVNPQKQGKNFKIDVSNIDFYAKEYFPLCMQQIYKGLKKNHQLKHWGRLQLGLFLKGANMPLAEVIKLFSNELNKLPDGNKKQSEYKYYIEHMFGKKGKKTDYTPWGCPKVAEKAIPSGNDIYGCPFKYYSDNNLKNTLASKKLDSNDIEEVIKARKEGFNFGCRKLFEFTHDVHKVRPSVGKHPNGYVLSSYFAKSKNKAPDHVNNLC